MRYPNGGSTIYEMDRIPSTLTVDVGTNVELRIFGRVKELGTYTVSGESRSNGNEPRSEVRVSAGSFADNETGSLSASAGLSIREYIEGVTFTLSVSYRASLGDGSSESVQKTVTVRLRGQRSSTTSSNQSQTGTITVFTFIPPSSSTTSASASETSTTYTPSTVKWVTSTTEVRDPYVSPSKRSVDAGDVASFKVCPSIDSPKFRLEDLPTGYRYLV